MYKILYVFYIQYSSTCALGMMPNTIIYIYIYNPVALLSSFQLQQQSIYMCIAILSISSADY